MADLAQLSDFNDQLYKVSKGAMTGCAWKRMEYDIPVPISTMKWGGHPPLQHVLCINLGDALSDFHRNTDCFQDGR